MMERSWLLICFALFCSSVLAVPKCGKRRTFKAKYGRSGEFQSVEGIASTCKYRIRGPPGLHINLTFSNFHTNRSIFQVSITPKKASRAVTNALTMSGKQGGHVAEFSDIVIRIVTSRAATAASILYKAIIPADGNFGFDFRANKKATVIKSPGFPKTKLPSNIHSVWNIAARKGQAITLKITKFSTTSDEDYLQVMDGTELIAKHSGKKRPTNLPIINHAKSGKMVIYLNTNTPNSKGFSAKVFAANISSAARPEDSASSSEGLQCHRRSRAMSSGTVISDDHSRMTCSDGDVCGRMTVERTTIVDGRPSTMVGELLNCIPSDLCIGICPVTPPLSSILVKSCNLSCCSTDWCNSSPDGPKFPPETPVTWSPSFTIWPTIATGRSCYQGSEVRRQSGLAEGSHSGGDLCPTTSTCALYIFSGTPSDAEGEIAAGYVTKCAAKSECNEAACSSLIATRNINIGSCNVTCCDEDYCNDPYEATIPVVPTPEPYSEYCYDIQRKLHESNIIIDVLKQTFCGNEGDRCLRVDAALVDDQGRNVMASYGKCVAKSSCETVDCSTMFGFANAAEVTTCEARCCDTDLCNDYPLWLDPPSVQGTSLWCHSKSETLREGVIMVGDGPPNSMCNDGYVCALYKFHGTSTDKHQLGEPMAGFSAMCRHPSDCDEDDCRRYATSKDVAAQTCSATCCRTNMCNEPGDRPMPSPRPPSDFGIECFDMLQSSVAGSIVLNKTTETSCGPNFSCMRIEAEATSSGGKVFTVYGGCFPKAACNALDCSLISGIMSEMKTEGCRAHCCETDLCNNQTIPTTNPPLVASP